MFILSCGPAYKDKPWRTADVKRLEVTALCVDTAPSGFVQNGKGSLRPKVEDERPSRWFGTVYSAFVVARKVFNLVLQMSEVLEVPTESPEAIFSEVPASIPPRKLY